MKKIFSALFLQNDTDIIDASKYQAFCDAWEALNIGDRQRIVNTIMNITKPSNSATLKLYRLSQDTNGGYDTYDSVIVAAKSEEEAIKIHPSGYEGTWSGIGTWAFSPDEVQCEYLGKAASHVKSGVVLASFNAG